MTKREAAIVTAYTGYAIGEFHDTHVYIEQLLGRPVQTTEMANPQLWEQIRQAAKADFVALEVSDG